MKLHSDHDLNRFGALFVARRYARYMTFDQFMENPEHHATQIERGAVRPLLLRQRRVQNAIERARMAANHKRRVVTC